MQCYLCDSEITELNKTNEHIIPRGLGNNIESATVLCNPCNNELGSEIDAALISQLGILYQLVALARPGTRTDAVTNGLLEDGTRVRFEGLLRPEIPVEIHLPGLAPVKFTAQRDEIESKARKKLVQLKKRFHDLDVDKAIAGIEIKEYPERLIYFSNSSDPKQSMVGSPAFFRGIKKIAVNFYLHTGGDPKYIRDVIHQVKTGEPAKQVISKFYYPAIRPVYVPAEGEVSHIIKLVGDPDMGVLYCYVELFNTNSAIILLNDDYDGHTINQQYHYDLINRQHLAVPITLPFKNRNHVTDHFIVNRDTSGEGNATYQRTRRLLEDMIRAKGLFI